MTIEKLSEYGHTFQIKVLSLLLNDREFLQGISDSLSDEYFDSPSHKWIINYILQYYFKYHTNPSMDVLAVEVKKEKNEVLRASVKEELKEAYYVDDEDFDYIKEEFSTFCLNQKLKNALLDSVDMLKQGEYNSIRILINNALKSNGDRGVGHIYDKDVETRYRKEERNIIETPWPVFNAIMEDGGYGSGDLILIFAPPGIGKSWFVCKMGAHAVMKGLKVLHYTIELSESYVGKRYDSIFTGIPISELRNNRDVIENVMYNLSGELIIKEYAPGRASLETLENHMDRLKNEKGFVPDLIIIDYPDLLKSSKDRKDLKQEIDEMYVSIKGMAKEKKVPIICPSQINRAGSNDDVIEGDKVAGSYNKMMIGDFNISISRKRKDKLKGTGRIHIMKSRLGPDGQTFPLLINMTNGKIEILDEEYDDEAAESSGDFIESEVKKKISEKFLKNIA